MLAIAALVAGVGWPGGFPSGGVDDAGGVVMELVGGRYVGCSQVFVPWSSEAMKDGFGFQRRQIGHEGKETCQQGTHDRSGKTAPGYFLGRVVIPGKLHLNPLSGELD